MKFKTIHILFIICSLWMISCDRPVCENENPLFKNNEPNSNVYKNELAKQLNRIDNTKLRYWLQKYEDINGEESLYFNIQAENLCAVLHLSMNHWQKLETVREKKGIGRRGAEFTNLKFEIFRDTLSTKFIYQTYERLID